MIPPAEWSARTDSYDDLNFTFSSATRQIVTGMGGAYQLHKQPTGELRLKDYRAMEDRIK